MLAKFKTRFSRRQIKRDKKINRAVLPNRALIENLEVRTLMSTSVSGYSSIVTDIQAGGPFATTSAYVNGGINATTGPFQFQSFAVVEFDPANSTVFTGAAQTAPPTNLSLTLVNNPDGYNSQTGAVGNVASGSFNVYLLPTYTALAPLATSSSALVYNPATGAGLPLGLQSQGGFSGTGVIAGNYLLGTFPAPTINGPFTVNLTLPTGGGSLNASTLLTTDIGTNAKFQLAIVPATSTSEAQFAGETNYTNDSGNPTSANGVAADGTLDESPQISFTASAVAESFSTPYAAITVDQDNVSEVAEIDILRSGYAGDSATVNYATADGTGLAGTDYTATSGTVTFAPNQTVAVVSAPIFDTGNANDVNFSLTLSSPASLGTPATAVSLATQHTSTVTIIGATNEADTIGGTVADENNNNSFILSQGSTTVETVKPAINTFAPVNGSVTNGMTDFATESYQVLSFDASAAQSSLSVTGLSSLTLELDNYNSAYNSFSDGTTIPSSNPEHAGNFNVYLLEASPTSSPTNFLYYQGADANGGGLNGADTAVLLGTASFSDQDTANSPKSGSLGLPEGIQDTYTFELSPAAQTFLKNALNASGSSFNPIRLAVTPGSAAFAADFASNNSTTGGNFGIQPYLWFNGTAVSAPQPAENFAINYSTVSVNANENVVEVDVARSGLFFAGDSATVNFSLSSGSAQLGTDFSMPASTTVNFAVGQTVATISIPIIPNSSATTEKSFTITLSGASTSGSEPQPTFNATPTVITITPPVAATQVIEADNNTTAEVGETFASYAYLNGSVANGTGSFAFQGFEVLEFQPSQFIQPGQELTSLSDLSLGLANYENTPGANYSGPPGDFTIYLAGANESIQSTTAANVTYNNAVADGVGGFANASGAVGPLSATSVAPLAQFDAIPLGVVSFNSKLGMDFFTPTQAALNQMWTVPDLGGKGISGTTTALQLIENEVNAGQAVRLLAAPGNSAFHAYFYGVSTGGPSGPQLLVKDTIATNLTEESVSFSSPTYDVGADGETASITVTRSLVTGSSLSDSLTVNYASSNNNALSGTNYTGVAGSLTFAPFNTTQVITVPIADVPFPALSGDTAFTLTLFSPATSDTAHTSFVAPILGNNPTATVFITDNANNASTLTQYTSSVGDIGTNGPVTFGSSALNPSPPFNFSIARNGRYTALDFNDSSVINFNDPAEFNGPSGPLIPTGPSNGVGPTYTPPADEPLGTGLVVFTPTGTISALNEITLNFINYYSTTAGMQLNVYLVADATSNILPGVAGTSKNPHYYDTSGTPDGNGFIGAADGVGNQFGAVSLLGTITNPAVNNESGYTQVPLTDFSATTQATLINDLNNGIKFRIIVAPESTNTASDADWIYGYTVANPGYATNSGNPINYYIQPELSFDVSYASAATPLPSYLTPSANADYLWEPTTGNLTLTNGSITFAGNVALSGDTTDPLVNVIASGPNTSVIFSASEQIAGLTLSGGANAVITANAGAVVITPSLTINAGSTLDITTNKVVINYGSPANDPAATLVPILAAAHQSGWSAGTIFSSAAAANSTKFDVGYLDGNNAADRRANSIEPNQFAIQYVLAGDAFLENTVGFDDLVSVAQNFGFTGQDFAGGNFNYDPSGSVGFADLVNVAQNFGLSSGVSAGSAPTGAAPAGDLADDATTTSPVAVTSTVAPPAKQRPVIVNPQQNVSAASAADSGNDVLDSVLGDGTQSSELLG